MIRFPNKITNFNAFVDGVGFAGLITKAGFSGVSLMEASHRAGGMDGPVSIDMGTEMITATLVAAGSEPELHALIGTRKPLVLRPASTNPSPNDPTTIITLGGLWGKLEVDDFSPGKDTPFTYKCSCDRVQFEQGGKTLLKISTTQFVREVDGVDQLAAQRRQMGL